MTPWAAVTRFLRDLESHQLQRLETRMPVAADDEVVVHRNAQRARDLDDRPRHVDVGARGGRIAGGMVVHQTTASANGLRALDFQSHMPSLGAVLGDGKDRRFVIIPLLHFQSHELLLEHD
jgi:hypothetical protein